MQTSYAKRLEMSANLDDDEEINFVDYHTSFIVLTVEKNISLDVAEKT